MGCGTTTALENDIKILKIQLKHFWGKTDDEVDYMIEIYKDIYPSVWFEHPKDEDESEEYYEVNSEITGRIQKSCIMGILQGILKEKWRFCSTGDLKCRLLKKAADESFQEKVEIQTGNHRENLCKLTVRAPTADTDTVCEIECEHHKANITKLVKEREDLYKKIDSATPKIYTH